MDFLLDIAKPDIVFITEIAPNHLEQFLTLENYRNEKLKITKKTSCVIAHSSQRQYIDCEATFFWIGAMADFDVSHVRIDETGTHAKINAKDTSYQLNLPVFGVFHIENILPLYIIAEKFGIDGASVGRYLEDFRPQSGRSGMIEGISNATIIDGSYNGGYLSIREGVSALIPPFSAGRIILLLGDMRELWKETESIHKMLAHDMNNIIPPTADVHFFLVWPYMEKYFAPSLDTRFHPFVTLSSEEAWEKVRDFLMENEKMRTTIFVKGSQNTIFLEEAIKKVLLHPSDEKLLCRQSKDWMKKKRAFFEGVKKDL